MDPDTTSSTGSSCSYCALITMAVATTPDMESSIVTCPMLEYLFITRHLSVEFCPLLFPHLHSTASRSNWNMETKSNAP